MKGNKMFRETYYRVEQAVENFLWKVFKKSWQPLYWFRCRTFDRYHIIDISNQDDYKYGYLDTYTKIEIVNFALVVDFVENSEPFKHHDWSHDEVHKKAAKDLMEIYNWWKTGKKEMEEKANQAFKESKFSYDFIEIKETKNLQEDKKFYELKTMTENSEKYAEYNLLQDKIQNTTERLLLKILKIRKFLWT